MQRRALVALDETATCSMIGEALQSVGMDSLTLSKSTDAESLLQAERFELIFLDYHAELNDGAELVRRLRNLPAHRTTPVVLISEDKDPHALSKGFAAGASFFLYRPVENRSVLQLVRATQGAIENERRRTRRVPLCSKVLLINNQQALHADTVDVSMNGLLVQARSTLPVGSSVEVHLRPTPQETPVRGFGCIVRHAARNQMGIQLGHLGATERERLQEFLLHLVPLELFSSFNFLS